MFVFFDIFFLDWEFTDSSDDTSYDGYYIQLLLIRIVIVLGDAIMYSSAINASIPWLMIAFTAGNCCIGNKKPSEDDDDDDKYLTEDDRDNILKHLMCCNLDLGVWNPLLSIFVVLIFVSAFADMFDWDATGFWSLQGYSQGFGVIVLISYILISFWLLYIAYNLDSIQSFVQNVHSYSNINKRNKNSQDFQL